MNTFVLRPWINQKGDTHSYADCEKFLNGRPDKKVASSVWVIRVYDVDDLSPVIIRIVLFDTSIITYYPNEFASFAHGGWETRTTTCRLGQFGPKDWRFWGQQSRIWASHRDSDDGMDWSHYVERSPGEIIVPVYPVIHKRTILAPTDGVLANMSGSKELYRKPLTKELKHDGSTSLYRGTQMRRILQGVVPRSNSRKNYQKKRA